MVFYIILVLLIGVYYSKRASTSSDEFFIGGRSLGPWVSAMSAEASDMSGWLLMGLPGVAYWCGLADAFWTALGLGVGTYINWLIVAKPLRRYTQKAGNAITIPDFFSKRYGDNKRAILFISSLVILIFFAVYTGSCFAAGGKLFGTLFGLDYRLMMFLTAIFIMVYTLLGGFLAVCMSDFVQGIIMIGALILVFAVGLTHAGGWGAMMDNLHSIPGFVEFFGIAQPDADPATGQQIVQNGIPLFKEAGAYGIITVVSTLSWGLGYFGMPQVLLRFVAIRKVNELTRARRIAIIWVAVSLFAAVVIGLMGRELYPDALLTGSASESVIILISTTIFHPVVIGVIMAGILAAIMSSSDSYLLAASSAVAKDLYQGIFKKDASERNILFVSRLTLLAITIFGVVIAFDPNSVIFQIVSFAWAGFGAAFGPLMLFSLFWRRANIQGAIAGLVAGAAMVFVWKFTIRPMGGIWGIYELLPAFLVSCIAIVAVSLATKPPKQEVTDLFDEVRAMKGEVV
jgi:sodium/proline symporter